MRFMDSRLGVESIKRGFWLLSHFGTKTWAH